MEEMPRRRVDVSGVEAGCFVSAARKNLADGLVLPMLQGILKKWLDEECIPKPANLSTVGALLAEKPGILVVHKPAGITTENFVKMVEVAVAVPLCAVSRLDHPTSGVLPIAVGKEDSGPSKWLKAQFAGRLVIKEYLCLCEGQSLGSVGQKGHLSHALLPGAFQAHTEVCSFGREADTIFTVQARYSTEAAMASGTELMQLLVRPVTGRKHQIRAHFASIGRPLVGDRTYGKKLKSTLPTPRLFLHCHYLKFFDLQGKDVVVEDPLPLDLQKILAALKLQT